MVWIALRAIAAVTCAVSLASPALAQDAPLSLDLVCVGHHADVPTLKPGSEGVTNRNSKESLLMHVSFDGELAEIIYPNGIKRTFNYVSVETKYLKAGYTYPFQQAENIGLIWTWDWILQIDLRTRNIRLIGDENNMGFLGVCEAAPTVAKF